MTTRSGARRVGWRRPPPRVGRAFLSTTLGGELFLDAGRTGDRKPAPATAAVTAIFTDDAAEALPAATALHGGPDAAVAFCRGLLMCDILFFSIKCSRGGRRQRGDSGGYSGAAPRQGRRVRGGGASAARLPPRVPSPTAKVCASLLFAHLFVS